MGEVLVRVLDPMSSSRELFVRVIRFIYVDNFIYEIVVEFQSPQIAQSHVVSHVELLDETVVQSGCGLPCPPSR
ncbi:hypothetical protein CEXT_251321 [Caerostris extrusa]|uniref:Uncharacterized protein n=1 Tax=Caerostris extrusa TaxID=172846 RepID=A0AAV4QFT3_CAEEX|nr:hypothetical protein CEXT_251321 [Caerostris extrusa]